MSDKIYFTYDEDGHIVGIGDATEMAEVQKQFFLGMIDLIGDDVAQIEDIMPYLQGMPADMIRPVVAVTVSQLLTIIRSYTDFVERNGIESKAAFRQRWHETISGMDEGDADG